MICGSHGYTNRECRSLHCLTHCLNPHIQYINDQIFYIQFSCGNLWPQLQKYYQWVWRCHVPLRSHGCMLPVNCAPIAAIIPALHYHVTRAMYTMLKIGLV